MDLTSGNTQFAERRTKPRCNCNYPALIRGRDALGGKYEENARVTSLSRSGSYVLLKRAMQDGEVLSVRIAFPSGSQQWGTPKLATNGVVVRSEANGDGLFGIAILFQNFKFL
jgi:hypothetical protein